MVRKHIPVAGVIALALVLAGAFSVYFVSAAQKAKNEERAVAAREIIVRLTMINNEIQRERAFVAAFGHSGMPHEGVEREIAATDEYCLLLLPQIEAMTNDDGVLRHQRDTLGAIAPALDRLMEIRANAGNDRVSPLETFDAYTEVTAIVSQAAAELHGELTIPDRQQALGIKLLTLIEYLARERGYGMAALSGAIPESDVIQARQNNMAALEQLQSDLDSSYSEVPVHGAMLTPFLSSISRLHPFAGRADMMQSEDQPVDVDEWFIVMTGHIDAVRLLHTRLLLHAGDDV